MAKKKHKQKVKSHTRVLDNGKKVKVKAHSRFTMQETKEKRKPVHTMTITNASGETRVKHWY